MSISWRKLNFKFICIGFECALNRYNRLPLQMNIQFVSHPRSQLTCHCLYTDTSFLSKRVRLSVRVFRMGAHNKELHNCNNFHFVLDVTSNGNSFADSVQEIRIISDRSLFKLIEFILLNGLVCEHYKIKTCIQSTRFSIPLHRFRSSFSRSLESSQHFIYKENLNYLIVLVVWRYA